MKQQTIADYAKEIGLTRQAVFLQIKEKRLPKNVKAKKFGNIYILTIKEEK